MKASHDPRSELVICTARVHCIHTVKYCFALPVGVVLINYKPFRIKFVDSSGQCLHRYH